MKANQIKSEAASFRRVGAPAFTSLLLFFSSLQIGYADSATWSANPENGNWNTADNWTPPTIPNGPADIASFGVSNQTDVSISTNTKVSAISFGPGASAFTI